MRSVLFGILFLSSSLFACPKDEDFKPAIEDVKKMQCTKADCCLTVCFDENFRCRVYFWGQEEEKYTCEAKKPRQPR